MERPRAGETRPSGAAPLIPDGLDAILVLLRHGETEFIVDKRFQGQMEAPLSKAGELQARLAGRRLASPGGHPPLPIPDAAPFAIVHSPLGRARRTAEYVVEALAETGRVSPHSAPNRASRRSPRENGKGSRTRRSAPGSATHWPPGDAGRPASTLPAARAWIRWPAGSKEP